MNPGFDGLVLIDKPAGPTSHDVVSAVRRAAGRRRVGHSGTLDPPASGLLVLALGRATRLLRFLPDTPKLYTGTLQLGLSTTTDDLAGEVTERHDGPLPSADDAIEAAAGLTGPQAQVPPAVSARKVGGQRLYKLARRGETVDAPAAAVEVFRFELAAGAEPGLLAFRADVSAGTYIRSLARDLGRRLGCGGALATLRRTAIGPFRLEDADDVPERGVSDWQPRSAIPLDAVPLAPPPLELDDGEAGRFVNGGKIDRPDEPEGWVGVRDQAGKLLGVGRMEAGLLCPRVVVGAGGAPR